MSVLMAAVFLLCLTISVLLTRSVREFAIRNGWVIPATSRRHIHDQPVPRLGGVAIYFAFVIGLGTVLLTASLLRPGAVSGWHAYGLLWPATLVFFLGLWDDIRPVNAKVKFSVQAIAAVLLYGEGYRVNYLYLVGGSNPLYPVLAFGLTVLWVLWITNAFNLIDGMDGLAAGSALFSTAAVFAVSIALGNRLEALITAALAGAILGFLRYNFNPASIFLGDSGSLFIGFILSAVALTGSQKAPTLVAVAIPVLAFGLPLLDVGLAVARRWLRGKPLFEPDADHIHHRLLKRGLTHRHVVLILYGVSAILAMLSLLLLSPFGYKWGVVSAAVAGGIFLGLHELRYHEVSELRRVCLRFMRQRKIIANNLRIIDAVDALAHCKSMAEICMTLTEALEPAGYSGIAFKSSELSQYSSSLVTPMIETTDGEFVYSWTDGDIGDYPWRLSLELVNSRGENYGSFSIVRCSYDDPILIDGHVFATSYRLTTAIADAVERSVNEMCRLMKKHGQRLSTSQADAELLAVEPDVIPIPPHTQGIDEDSEQSRAASSSS